MRAIQVSLLDEAQSLPTKPFPEKKCGSVSASVLNGGADERLEWIANQLGSD